MERQQAVATDGMWSGTARTSSTTMTMGEQLIPTRCGGDPACCDSSGLTQGRPTLIGVLTDHFDQP
jgi:hypothetical protein